MIHISSASSCSTDWHSHTKVLSNKERKSSVVTPNLLHKVEKHINMDIQ